MTGHVTVGRIRGIPIRLHWSLPIGLYVLSGFRFDVSYALAFVVIILGHELGHALVARRLGLAVHEVVLHGFGGHCRHALGRDIDHQAIAWGGVLAQGWLQVAMTTIALIAARWLPWGATTNEIQGLADAVTSMNLRLIVLNLLPIPPLDGHLAWQLPRTLWRGDEEGLAAPNARARSRATSTPHLVLVREPVIREAEEVARKALEAAKRGDD